ncbi:MAG: 50S ribosomal protein L20 [Christensenellaceae bacterium]|jgi:large subunit ribosomal protein L20
MARIKRAVNGHKKRRKVLKLAKGYFGAKSKQYKSAKQAVMKSMQYAYAGRKRKKRDMRKLWIVRINAEARVNEISYSQFMNGLKRSGITLNRKVLADMAVNDKAAFKKLADTAKKSVQA